MSAIWGSISFNNELDDTINQKITEHYDTNCKIDNIQTITGRGLIFGCGIQYLTKEATSEKLPYYNEDNGYYLTADAILDNRAELIEKLDINDKTIPDGTLICLAYEKWGVNLTRHLRGLFSIAIYETASGTLYLIADQMSSRCLYYYYNDNHISFSTLAAPLRIIHPGIGINELYIKDFLTAPGLMPNIISSDTPFDNVHMLNPGTYLKITAKSLEEVSYWTPTTPLADCHCSTPEEYSTYFRNLYESCVHDALRTDGNIGIAMSSGLDSATVGAIAAKALAKDNRNLYSYTYVPYEKPAPDNNRNNVHDESEDVKMIHKMYPNIIAEFLNNGGKNCYEHIPEGVRVLEMPYKAYANMPNLFEIYKKASDASCKVVLCGQMGNSTVSHGYIDDVLYDLYSRKHYIRFLMYLNNYSKTVKESRKEALKGCRRYFKYADTEYKKNTFSYTPDNPFLSDNIMDNYPFEKRYINSGVPLIGGVPTPGQEYHKYMYLAPMFTYLGALETKVGLAFGIVLRDPTMDMRMLSFCYNLPYHLFACKGTPRWLIRSSCRDLLPHKLLDNWMRYGVQNSDFITRIIRDWDTISTDIRDELSSEIIKPYINNVAINELVSKSALTPEDESQLMYLIFYNVLYQFMSVYN